ncbi:TrkH family potassium uptake protein [Romboutsia sp. Marseille-P6047]|uniref:TrkH family potassium uptake protein n=1 Tax=Romboutsia sp. Marseille-P6047 TaxID=2161817 RepID=UPI000820ABFE|nr:TrkH family potassium uptake protein [Romboutsia sp. Marseille-P6047]SCH98402.1 Trk system potassium uptake protein trkG [uncultured Clostridium sp.]
MVLKKINDFKGVLYCIGILSFIVGLILLLPLLILPFYPDEVKYIFDFIIPSLISILLGCILNKISKHNKETTLSVGEDALIVVLGWILATVLCAIPFILGQKLNFTQAFFESVSGWTTTGLSVINVESTPKIFLIFRSIMQFFGGVGIILVMLSALSSLFGMSLYNSEGHTDKLLPNLVKSSRIIISMYLGYIISGTILYVLFGMPLFDAINHAIGSLSTGGFSVKSESIGFYNNVHIELITIILMILGTTSFATHLLIINGKFKKVIKIGEIRFMFLILGIAIPLVAFISLRYIYSDINKLIRVSVFETVSALSTTGYSTVSYNRWPSFAIFIMIILMLIGGGSGSTSGGIKLYRVYLILKQIFWNIKRRLLPEHMVYSNYVYKPEGKHFINKENMMEVYNYITLYLFIFIFGVGVMLAYNYPLEDAMFEFSSALGTVGLSIGITSASAPPIVLWTEIIGMLFGRLEIVVILIAIVKIIKGFK